MFGQVVDVVFSCRYCNREKVFLPLYMLNRFHTQGTKKTFVISGSNFWLSNNFVNDLWIFFSIQAQFNLIFFSWILTIKH